MSDEWERPVPQTGAELSARWAERDDLYARLRRPPSPESIEAVRAGRMDEAAHLPRVEDRAKAYAEAQTWKPPIHPEFGSLRDWLDG